MRKFIFATVLLFSSFLFVKAETQSKEIIIKFTENSKYLALLSQSNQIEELNVFFENHKIKPLVPENILTALYKRAKSNKKSKNLSLASENQIYSKLASISRIFIVEFSSAASENLIVKKLSNNPNIEYAEPLPERKLLFVPNDSSIDKQYYLNLTQCFEAWDLLDSGDPPLVAIVDTGIDYNHEDLAANIYTNPGESGLDEKGRDKRFNGIDDDENGFIDDYRGWDFISSTNENGDNDPKPGNPHGTHVAGIVAAVANNGIGIAGVSNNARLLPVKIGPDDANSISTQKSYQGILYAASLGADIINCSWGGPHHSASEHEIVEIATALGSLIVGAAGNESSESYYYPASYPEVLSVASTDESDYLSQFSNYNYAVDLTAPGSSIYSTLPNNQYAFLDGTSMATPIASGIAAMVSSKFPELNPIQIKEHIKNNTDNIEEQNPFYAGVIGTGRINALKALSNDVGQSIILKSYSAVDTDKDGDFLPGDEINIYLTFQNILKALDNARVEASAVSRYKVDFTNANLELGSLMTLEEKSYSEPISFIVPSDVDFNYIIYVKLNIYEYEQLINSEYIPVSLNPSYKTMRGNNISLTFNSVGNLAYNDYPLNIQGEGFNYKDSKDMLFEGSLLVARSRKRISNVARGDNQFLKDNSFDIVEHFEIEERKENSCYEGAASFKDRKTENDAGVDVSQKVYQFYDEGKEDFIILRYDIFNKSESPTDSIFTGLFLDWDIGPSGLYNYASFDSYYGFGYARNIEIDTLPWVGVNMLSSYNLSYFAIDNDGRGLGNPGIYDGFSNYEKWFMLSEGITRKKTNVTDISMVIGAGPIKLNIGDSASVAFSIFCGNSLEELRKKDSIIRRTAIDAKIADGSFEPLPRKTIISSVVPNPVQSGDIAINYEINDNSYINLDLYDVYGNLVKNFFSWSNHKTGRYQYIYNTDYLSQGAYLIVLRTAYTIDSYFFIKCK